MNTVERSTWINSSKLLAIAFSVAGVSACAPEYAGVILTIQDIPETTARLIVRPVIDGKTITAEVFEQGITGLNEVQVGLRLPRTFVGSKLSLTVDAQSDQNCISATAQENLDLNSVMRYDLKIPLKKTAFSSVVADLYAIHGSAANDIWVSGANGVTAHFDGCGWKSHPITNIPGESSTVYKLYVPPRQPGDDLTQPNTAFAIMSPGVVRMWDGTQWQPSVAPPSGKFSAIHGSSRNNIWAVGEGASGGCVLYRYDGSSWVSAVYCQGTPGYYMRAVHVVSDTTAFAGGTENGLPVAARFNRQMSKWEPINFSPMFPPASSTIPGNISAVYASQDGVERNAWVGGELNTLHFNDATGGTFSMNNQVSSSIGAVMKPSSIVAMSGSAGDDIWLVSQTITGTSKTSYVFHYTAGKWNHETRLSSYLINNVWVNTKNDVWFVGPAGLRIRYDGQTFAMSN